MAKLDMTSQQRSTLRAAAHSLRPVVLIGERGLTDPVIKEIDLNLNAHQLIKVRVSGDDREARVAMIDRICDALSCALVHHLGKTLILYRPDLEAERKKHEAEYATRALRKPSEPYVPKKQASQGAGSARKAADKAARTARSGAAKPAKPAEAPPRARRSTGRPGAATSPRPAHGIPRRSGSALSLRAGARRGLRSGKG
ncbi:YhbY family RNA-binding protein [Allopusillimonas soli]|uniref:YhbY family RNA-binding protein n=1 Tax=Allopusillimonas soli TaxID=659016 RepID=A0A853FL03_9BURK|nr:YhbY family RNA-binding protein [Allopusillimonas soli]NYT38576.1 YhbY family RNA-binding protein [Allopusillimonas soli]TEA71709.1 YhbY family RNA-binding protein [Allopusillimonas soli]